MSEATHRFAVVLAADVVGYSRQMELDGERALSALQRTRAVFRKCVEEYNGVEFGSVGDSLMAEFQSPIEALRVAKCIQRDLTANLSGADDDSQLQIRIGLHAGDVISDGEDLFGDVVNTAARLQEIAQPGGIVLSGLMYEQVKKDPGFEFRSLGRQPLKNIAEPVAVYEVVRQYRAFNWRRLRLAFIPYRSALAAVAGMVIAGILIVVYMERREPVGPGTVIEVVPANSVAVLPFEVDGTDEELPVLKGLQCGVISRLDKLAALDRVTACRSASRQDSSAPIKEIGKELEVSKLLFGDVRQQGGQVHVEVELIEVANGARLWGNSYSRDLTVEDLFEIESDIARKAVAGLGLALSAEDDLRLGGMPTFSIDALREFQRGRFELERRESAALDRALEHFQKAIEIDPMYADAHIELANSFGLKASWYIRYYSGGGSPKQRQYLLDWAMELDPDNGLAVAGLGLLRYHQGDVDEAEEYYQRAIDLIPNAYQPYVWYSTLLARQQRFEEAFEKSQKAHEIAPKEPVATMQLIWRLDRLERYDEALELAYEGLEANSNFANFYRYIYMTHWNAGEVGKALRWAEAAQTVAPWDPFANLYVCQLYFRMQDYEQTELCFEGLRPHGKFFYQHYVALLRQRGEIDEIPGILAWHAKQPIGSQGRFKLFTNDRYRIEEAYHWMQIGDWDRAFDIMRTYGPYLFDEDGQFTGNVDLDAPLDKGFDRYMALYAAIVLQKQGHADRADAILEAILEWVDANGPFPRDPFDPGQFWGGPMNAIQIHAIRGDREAVLQVLKDGIDEGYLGWFGQDGPVFNFIRDDPEWKKQMNRLGENTERQWQIYRELKNEPLF